MATIHGTNNDFQVPSLDLRFADRKNLVDTISGSNLITFSRDSIGTYVDANGVIQSAASGEARFDHNPSTLESLGLLVEQSSTNSFGSSDNFFKWTNNTAAASNFTNATIAPNGQLNAYKVIPDSGTTGNVRSGPGGIDYQIVTYSVYVKAAEYEWINISYYASLSFNNWFNVGTGELGTCSRPCSIESAGNGWYRCVVYGNTTNQNFCLFIPGSANGVAAVGDGSSGIYVWGPQVEAGSSVTSFIPIPPTFTSRASTATYYDSAGVIQTAGIDVARSNAYFPDENGVMQPAGLLLEGSGTNLSLNSENATGKTNQSSGTITVTTNTTVAPDSNTTADTIAFASDIANGRFQVPFSSTAGVTYTASFWIKHISGGTLFSMWDPASSTIKSFTATSSWQHVSLTFVAASTSASYYCRFIQAVDSVASSFAVWGHQIEASPYPTSYIPTAGSTVTRAADVSTNSTVTRSADVASITGTNFSSWYRQDEGSFFASYAPSGVNPSTAGQAVFAASDDTATDRVYLAKRANVDQSIRWANNKTGAANTAFINLGTLQAQPYAFAGCYKENDFAASLDGAAVATDNTVELFTGCSLLTIGADRSAGQSPLNGTISRLTYYPTRLSNSLLQKLTK